MRVSIKEQEKFLAEFEMRLKQAWGVGVQKYPISHEDRCLYDKYKALARRRELAAYNRAHPEEHKKRMEARMELRWRPGKVVIAQAMLENGHSERCVGNFFKWGTTTMHRMLRRNSRGKLPPPFSSRPKKEQKEAYEIAEWLCEKLCCCGENRSDNHRWHEDREQFNRSYSMNKEYKFWAEVRDKVTKLHPYDQASWEFVQWMHDKKVDQPLELARMFPFWKSLSEEGRMKLMNVY